MKQVLVFAGILVGTLSCTLTAKLTDFGGGGGGGGSTAWSDITGKPSTFAPDTTSTNTWSGGNVFQHLPTTFSTLGADINVADFLHNGAVGGWLRAMTVAADRGFWIGLGVNRTTSAALGYHGYSGQSSRLSLEVANNEILSAHQDKLVGITTPTPTALLHVAGFNGQTGDLFNVSTGATSLFKLTGSTLTVTVPTATFKTVVADTYITTGSGIAVWSAPISKQNEIDPDNDGTPVARFNQSSAVISGLVFNEFDRFTTPTFASGTLVTYIATGTLVSSSTLGAFQFDNAISSEANLCVFPWVVPEDIDLRSDIVLSSFGVTLGGADTNGHVYIAAITTTAASANATETLFNAPGASTAGVTITISGDASGAARDLLVKQSVTLTLWRQYIVPGALHYILIARDGNHASDASTVNSYSAFFTLKYKRRITND